jgi:hypothetical protein
VSLKNTSALLAMNVSATFRTPNAILNIWILCAIDTIDALCVRESFELIWANIFVAINIAKFVMFIMILKEGALSSQFLKRAKRDTIS